MASTTRPQRAPRPGPGTRTARPVDQSPARPAPEEGLPESRPGDGWLSAEPGGETVLGRVRRAVTDDLFPVSPVVVTGPRVVAALAGWWALLVLASLARQGGVGALDTLWAEDGSIFVYHALTQGLGEPVLSAYAGYLHLVPRLAAEAAVVVGVEHAARVVAVTGAGLAAGTGLVVWAASAGHLRSPVARVALGSAVVLLPAAAEETLNAVALAQWHLVFAALWLSLWRPRRTAVAVLAAVGLALTVLSAPLAFVVAPVVAARAVLLPRLRDRAVGIAFGLGATVQTWALVTRPAPNAPGGSPGDLLRGYGLRVVSGTFAGVEGSANLRAVWSGSDGVLVAVAVAAFAVALVRSRHRLTVLLLAVASLATFVGSVYLRGAIGAMIADDPVTATLQTHASRFVIVPALLLLCVVAFALDGPARRLPAQAWLGVRIAAVVWLALPVVGEFRVDDNGRAEGPRWSEVVADGRLACDAGLAPSFEVAVPPATDSFRFPLTCDELGAD